MWLFWTYYIQITCAFAVRFFAVTTVQYTIFLLSAWVSRRQSVRDYCYAYDLYHITFNFNTVTVTIFTTIFTTVFGNHYPQLIAGSGVAINEISMAIPIFSLVPDSTVIYATSPEVVFSCKSNMAAAKPEILLSQCRNNVAIKFQRIYIYTMFLGCTTQLCYMQHHRKLFSAVNPRQRTPNRIYIHCQCRYVRISGSVN